MLSRRDALKTVLAGVGTAAAVRINPEFFVNSAYAQAGKPLRFLAAEALTGNWDPTTHTNLGQLIIEGMMFGYLTRAPMRPDNPEELVFELATSLTPIDQYTLEVKAARGREVPRRPGVHGGRREGHIRVWLPAGPSGAMVSGPGRGRGGGQAHLPHQDREVRLSRRPLLLPLVLPADPLGSDVADKAKLAAKPNGTGPFRFVEQKGDSSMLEAYDGFFMGKPKLPGIEYRFVGDTTTRTLSLLNGEADLIERLEQEQVETISQNPNFVINKVMSTENKYLFFRCSKAPFTDWRVRRAACHAIDRSVLLEVLGMSGSPSKSHISPVKFGYTTTFRTIPSSIPKCQKLLAEAGFPNGQGLPELIYYTSTGFYPKTKEYGEVIASMLQEQGFPVKLQVLELAAWGNLLYDKEGGGEGNMIDCGWCTGSPEPDLVIRTHFHSSSKRITGIVDPDIDASLDKERNAASVDERRKILQEETLPLLAEKAPALALFTSVFLHAYRKELEGLYIYPNGMLDGSTATMS